MVKRLLIIFPFLVITENALALNDAWIQGAKLYKAVEIEHLLVLEDLKTSQLMYYSYFTAYTRGLYDACVMLAAIHGDIPGNEINEVFTAVANGVVEYEKLPVSEQIHEVDFNLFVMCLEEKWPEVPFKIIGVVSESHK